MGERGPTRAIVLAAGTGSRLVAHDPYPKPLKPVAGVALVVRILRTLQSEGIREAVVVVGYRGDQIKRALLTEPSLALRLHFVQNDEYDRKNGVSVLAAARWIERDCLLTMADHLYSPELVRRLRQFELLPGACVLAVDRDIERCFDLDDAMKVRLRGARIGDIGKDLSDYECIDTGVFRIGPELVAELGRVREATGDCSLADGVRALAAQDRFFACDVGDARWIDVDTPEALQRAEAMVRVFGDSLGDEPGASPAPIAPEALELFAPSWVRAVQPYNEDHFELAASRRGVTRMMSNESPFAPSERVVAAIVDAARRGNLYPSGASALRGKLGRREGFDAGHVTLGAGSTELIDMVIRTFVGPGEEVILSVPTFSMYESRTRAVGGTPVMVPLTDDNEVDIGGIVSAVTERTKLLFLCTPNNPTGNALDETCVRRILGLGLPTVIDEAYHEFSDEGGTYAHLLSEYPNAIVLRTFSKAFGLAGLRLGYALAHPTLTRLLGRVKLPWNVSAITIAAASAAIEDVEELEARVRRVRAGRDFLVRELGRIAGIDVVPSEGNFVLVDAARCGVATEGLVQGMLNEGVLIRSLAAHHAEHGLVRVTVGDEAQNRRCVEAMRRVVLRLSAGMAALEARVHVGYDAE
jgi:histidinol-phosphate aminotransferase